MKLKKKIKAELYRMKKRYRTISPQNEIEYAEKLMLLHNMTLCEKLLRDE